jgi:hypothetical protein
MLGSDFWITSQNSRNMTLSEPEMKSSKKNFVLSEQKYYQIEAGSSLIKKFAHG